MSKELEFLGKLKKLCDDYHFWIVPDVDNVEGSYLDFSDNSKDSFFVDQLIDFYSSDLPF